MPVTRNQAINDQKEDLPDSGEEGGEEQGRDDEEYYLPDNEDGEDGVSEDGVEPQTQAPAPAPAPSQKERSQARQNTNARIDSHIEVMQTMMNRLGDMETRISAQDNGGQGDDRQR